MGKKQEKKKKKRKKGTIVKKKHEILEDFRETPRVQHMGVAKITKTGGGK